MFDIKSIFKALGLPFGLIGVIVALLAWIGLSLDDLVAVAVTLVGLQLLLSFVIDVCKYVGLVDDGTSGKWSAAFNLLTLIGVAVWLKFFPSVDIHAIDNQIAELAKLLIYIFTYVTQLIGTKRVHSAIGIFSFSNNA
jgi:hypothetical protein